MGYPLCVYLRKFRGSNDFSNEKFLLSARSQLLYPLTPSTPTLTKSPGTSRFHPTNTSHATTPGKIVCHMEVLHEYLTLPIPPKTSYMVGDATVDARLLGATNVEKMCLPYRTFEGSREALECPTPALSAPAGLRYPFPERKARDSKETPPACTPLCGKSHRLGITGAKRRRLWLTVQISRELRISKSCFGLRGGREGGGGGGD